MVIEQGILEKIVDVREGTFDILYYQNPQPMIIYCINSLKIVEANAAALNYFGYSKEEFFKLTVRDLRTEDNLPEFDKLKPFLAQSDTIRVEAKYVLKDGRIRNVELVSYIINYQGKEHRLAQIHDITDRVREAENLEVINSTVKLIFKDLDLDSILQKVTDATTKLSGAEYGAFFYNTVNENGEAMALFTLSGAPRSAFEKLGMPRNTSIFHPTFTRAEVLRIDNVLLDSRYGKEPPHFGMPKGHLPVLSYMSIPVLSARGTIHGCLLFGHSEPGVFTKESEDLVSALVPHAAAAIDNAKLYEEVKNLNEKKDEFVSMASHELKTPLTTVKAYVQLLARVSKYNHKLSDLTSKAVTNISKLERLVSTFLDISKINSGNLEYYNDYFSIVEVIKDSIESVENSVDKQIILEVAEDVRCFGDSFRIQQVIVNLLNNAVKYSPGADKVLVSSQVEGNEVTVKVKDFGMGISKENQGKLFNRFHRINANSHATQGMGLGLYIVAEVVKNHGGRFGVESKLGEGSTFYFTLPIEKGNAQ